MQLFQVRLHFGSGIRTRGTKTEGGTKFETNTQPSGTADPMEVHSKEAGGFVSNLGDLGKEARPSKRDIEATANAFDNAIRWLQCAKENYVNME